MTAPLKGNCGAGHDPTRISCEAATEIARLRAELARVSPGAARPDETAPATADAIAELVRRLDKVTLSRKILSETLDRTREISDERVRDLLTEFRHEEKAWARQFADLTAHLRTLIEATSDPGTSVLAALTRAERWLANSDAAAVRPSGEAKTP